MKTFGIVFNHDERGLKDLICTIISSMRSIAMVRVSQDKNERSRSSGSNPPSLGRIPLFLFAAFVALPSTANASSWTTWWWGNWNSYWECMEHYKKSDGSWGYSPDEICTKVQVAQDDERRKEEETYRMIVLSCQAGSVTYAQAAACVALATGQ